MAVGAASDGVGWRRISRQRDRMRVGKVIAIAATCLILVLAWASVTYVHYGYVGVIDTGSGPRLLDRGIHFKRPFADITFYPTRVHEIHLRTVDEGVQGRIEFDVVLQLSVSRDSVLSLHEAYGGSYVERLISPQVVDYFRIQGNGSGDWGDGVGSEKAAEGIVERIHAKAGPLGIIIVGARIRSFDVKLKE
jgi:regulator of protease activity HflC (stomatin/prohibitin superfamily)